MSSTAVWGRRPTSAEAHEGGLESEGDCVVVGCPGPSIGNS